MPGSYTRRRLLTLLSTAAISACAPHLHRPGVNGGKSPQTEPVPPPSEEPASKEPLPLETMAKLEKQLGGRVGVFAFLPATGQSLEYRANERFALCSTFKWALAAAILQKVDAGEMKLSQELPFGNAELEQWAPIARKHVTAGKMTVEQCCQAAVTMSDNTASNLLMDKIGGPPGMTKFFRSVGDDVTRLDRDEPFLNENTLNDARDTTSPRAMAVLLSKLLTTNTITKKSRQLLSSWLVQTKTGAARIKAGLPSDLKVGHKTGTGNRGAVNDVAVFWTPKGDPGFIATYMSGSDRPLEELEKGHARIAALVFEALI